MENALSGLIVSILTQAVKKVPFIPINEGNKIALRGVAIVLSFLAAVIPAYLDGTLLSGGLLNTFGATLANYVFAVISYQGLIK